MPLRAIAIAAAMPLRQITVHPLLPLMPCHFRQSYATHAADVAAARFHADAHRQRLPPPLIFRCFFRHTLLF